ncbi:MAG: aldehyde dehydrogenase [Christensenellales bacterium]|jgi:lactaldehyde dehydrogenase/glycolaldehyde dehydrogenase
MQTYDLKMYINGEYKDASNGKKIEVLCPQDESVVGYVPAGTKEDADLALKAAKAASYDWAKLPAVERAAYVERLRDLIIENGEEFATILSREQGKPIAEARGEVFGGVPAMLTYAIGCAQRIEGDILTSSKPDEQILIQRVPFGVTVGIAAWNYPMALSARKFGIALVCGNTMVLKPPSVTPIAVMKLGELVEKAGIPKGVLNIVSGSGSEMGSELVRNPITQMVSLTGSTAAGQQIYRQAADNITVVRLELGGKAPFIVLDDADIDKAVEIAVSARFTNCGQVCICNERMYLQEGIYDEFMEKFLKKVSQLKIGPSLSEDTDIGPKVNKDECDKLWEMLERAKANGAKVVYGGETLTGGLYEKGYWFPPTILEVTDNSMEIMQEEIFGPMLPVMKVKDLDEAIKLANESVYGLSAYLFTKDIKNLMRGTRDLEFGEIYTNRPNGEEFNAFHNGYKTSGVGGEDGKYGMEGYLQKKTVYLNYAD